MTTTAKLMSILLLLLFCIRCKNTTIEEIESSKIQVEWQQMINEGEYYFGSENIHLFEDKIIVSGNTEFVSGNIQDETPTIKAFSQIDGTEEWNYEIEKDKFFDGLEYSFIVDNIFIGYFSNGILALNLDTQSELWSVDSPDIFSRSVPTIYENRIYRSYENYNNRTEIVVSHNIMDGSDKEHFSINSKKITSPIFWTNSAGELQKIVIANSPVGSTSTSSAYVYDSNDQLDFRLEDVPTIGRSNFAIRYPIVYDDILIIQGDMECHAYDLLTQEMLWKYDPNVDHKFGRTIPVVVNEKVILNMGEKDITCLSTTSGEVLWYNVDQCRSCSLDFLYDPINNLLLFSDGFEGKLLAINIEDGNEFDCCNELNGSGYNILYGETTNTYFSRTQKEIFSFKIEE